MEIRIDLVGDEELRKALSDPELVRGPLKVLLNSAAMTVRAEAVQAAPVDTGRLSSSITPMVEATRAVVSPTVFYAPFVEFGTRPHFPPSAALATWARRHGFSSVWPLVRAIGRRGTRPHPFMRPAAEKLKGRIPALLNDMARAIEEIWRRKHGG